MANHSTNRRQFLKTAGAASLTPSLFRHNVQNANARVNAAFIGVGRLGSENMTNAARAGFQITAVCDVCQLKLQRAQVRSRRLGFDGVTARQDFREILADKSVDAVCIATPEYWRPYITLEAFQAGKDVYVETPAFMSIEEGPGMVEAARKYQRVVQAGSIQRSGAVFQKARAIVQSGDLGDITFCRGFFPGPGNGALVIDTVQFAFDEAMPDSVTAQGTPDIMLVTFRYPGFIVSLESRCAIGSVTAFHGDRATLVVTHDDYGPRLTVTAPDGTARMSQRYNHLTLNSEMSSMHAAHWENFLECIKTRERPIGDIETCARSTTAWMLANLALRQHATLEWDDSVFEVKQNRVNLEVQAT